jgi:muconolactone delta-isomerase
MATTLPTSMVRAGDRDRAATAAQLGQALTQGYLDIIEYEQRVAAAFAAHSSNELRQLLADLPIAQLRRNDPRRREARKAAAQMSVRLHLAGYVLMVVIVLTVWLSVALSGGTWYFWPIWPILGAGIAVLGHAIPIKMVTRPTP